MVVDGKPTIWLSNSKDMAPWIIIDLEKEVTIWKVVITIRPIPEAFSGFAGIKVKLAIEYYFDFHKNLFIQGFLFIHPRFVLLYNQ